MNTILSVVNTVFWGLLTLSVLVFVHEGGHFLAARACGVRVTEFFLGLPCRFRLFHASKRIGTRFGITPLLLGGYAAICGMDPTQVPCAPRVLSLVHKKGHTTVDDMAQELGLEPETVLDACVVLSDWGSIAPFYDKSKGEVAATGYYPSTYESMPRDAKGNTVYDGRLFDRSSATSQGDTWTPCMSEEEFFDSERSRTYMGKGFAKRAIMLLAGILVNIVSGFLLLMAVYSVIGVTVSVNTNVLGTVEEGSIAAEAGLSSGDTILSIGNTECSDWNDITAAIDSVKGDGEVELRYKHDGTERNTTVSLSDDDRLGVSCYSETVHYGPLESLQMSWSYVKATASGVAELLIPQHTMEVLDNSTSVVGISIMSSQAAAAGPATYLWFAALISFSLGFMNLIPIPPLDGGKLLIEVIQLALGRNLSLKVQNIVSYIGVGLFMLLFVYMLRSDILRFFL